MTPSGGALGRREAATESVSVVLSVYSDISGLGWRSVEGAESGWTWGIGGESE